MTHKLTLASRSPIRAKLLQQAGIEFDAVTALVDEEMMKTSMRAEQAPHRDIADKLAEIKALKVSQKCPENFVLGCDQILSVNGEIFSKPKTKNALRDQLMALKSNRHDLFSAAVICQNAQPIWRFVGTARLTMRDFSETFLDNYIDQNWKSVENCVGGYQIEAEGIQLFQRVEGDYFSILGMPLLEILNFLTVRGVIQR